MFIEAFTVFVQPVTTFLRPKPSKLNPYVGSPVTHSSKRTHSTSCRERTHSVYGPAGDEDTVKRELLNNNYFLFYF